MSLFVTTVILQGSAVTRLRCSGQCNNHFVANSLMNSTLTKFRKSVDICQSYRQKYRGRFLTHSATTVVYCYFRMWTKIDSRYQSIWAPSCSLWWSNPFWVSHGVIYCHTSPDS